MAQLTLLALLIKKRSVSIVSFVSMRVESANCAKSAMQIFIETDKTAMQNLHEILEIVETVGRKASQESQLSHVIYLKDYESYY